MPNPTPIENGFLLQLENVIGEHIADENFGVSELAAEVGMSRSNLLRKIQKHTHLSASQYIRQVRLKAAMDLLKKQSFTVSEVSYKVGFSSTSYFIKCFREHYGYPPGEVGKRPEVDFQQDVKTQTKKSFVWVYLIAALAVIGIGYYLFKGSNPSPVPLEKSIVVLPFKNDSNDSTNLYLINGLMEATLNNLQKIKDLRVISRTSSEKYRFTDKSIPEMAEELEVSYFVEGSGQKIGDEILLNIQLIEGKSDKHLWASQYRRKTKDIFELQREIAENIAKEIKAIVTPEEKRRIEKEFTENVAAYEVFLKGQNLLIQGEHENLLASIPYFKQAIAMDETFALAYAELTMAYYYLDNFQVDQQYAVEIAEFADKAVLHDPKLAESLIAKAVYYIHEKQYKDALPYLEKALEYNPNSMHTLNFITDYYYIYAPNTEKYLEYALKAVKLEGFSGDSVVTSNNYIRLCNSLLQNGFINEAIVYANKASVYNPSDPVPHYLKIWNEYFINKDMQSTKEALINVLQNNPGRIDILQEVGKACVMSEDYQSACHYYNQFDSLRKAWHLNIYLHENLNMAIAYQKIGSLEKSAAFAEGYKSFADHDQSIYKHLYLLAYYAWKDDIEEAIKHLKLFAKEDNFVYWVLMIDEDLGAGAIKQHPEFNPIMDDIKQRFWERHYRLKTKLEVEGLL